MKVLITGENSYAGTQFAKRVSTLNKEWEIDYISVRNDVWKERNFSSYDAIYHVAAIVHQKEKPGNKELYYEVNRDITQHIAEKAKVEGVSSFIFLSTMAVYGLIGKIGEDTVISKETKENPISYYGESKLEAENLLNALQSQDFNVAILRIPMIYGPSCPGNYKSLRKLAKHTPVFPRIHNRRSMIFVDHLSDVVAYIIEKKLSGVLLVKNPEDISTLEMVKESAFNYNKKIYSSVLLGFLIKCFGNYFNITRKMFGNIYYKDEHCEINGFEYSRISFEESIENSVVNKI